MHDSKMFKINLALIVIALAIILVSFKYANLPNPFVKAQDLFPAKEIEIIGTEPEVKIVEIKPYKNILSKIDEGKRLLSASKPLQILMNGQKKEIALAILDTKNGDVFEKRYWLLKNDLDKANQIRGDVCEDIDHYPAFVPEDEEENMLVVVNWWNSLNSNLSIATSDCLETDRYIVVANKILIPNEYLVYPEDRTGKKYSDIVYVPYSEHLHQPEVVNEGLAYLNELVSRAFNQLKDLNIQSHAYEGEFVTDRMDEAFIKNIFINEQSDPKSMLASEDGGKKTAERALFRLGANKEKAFRYTYSSVGALGLAQIMPTTYINITHNYPEANLIKDEDIGRADILNSIKASILVHDDHYAAVVKRASQNASSRKLLDSKSKEEIEDIKAAIYNGGPGKYNHLTGAISMAIPETVSFLMKLDFIRKLNLFN